MNNEYDGRKYFQRFVKERNIKEETVKGYNSTINKYEKYYGCEFDELIQEAIDEEENVNIPKRQRSIKSRLLQFRTFLVTEKNLKISTIRNHMKQLKTLYKQFDIEVPDLPSIKDSTQIETTYFDLPSREQISMAVEIAGIRLGSMILMMACSGTGRKECAEMTVGDFIDGCEGYYTKETLSEIIHELYESITPIVPTFYLLRVKTQKKYYTFCTPETTDAILEWLILRLQMCEEKDEELKREDSLWGFRPRQISYHFQRINDELNFGYKEKYRFLRPHSLRKFNASNIGLSEENIDLIQGRSKDSIHATYIKTNPDKLKKIYMNVMENVTIGKKSKKEIIHEDFTINLNLNFYGGDCGITLE